MTGIYGLNKGAAENCATPPPSKGPKPNPTAVMTELSCGACALCDWGILHIKPINADVVIRPEAIPITKRPEASQSALVANIDRISPRVMMTKPSSRVFKKPILLLVRPKKSKVAKQPSIYATKIKVIWLGKSCHTS